MDTYFLYIALIYFPIIFIPDSLSYLPSCLRISASWTSKKLSILSHVQAAFVSSIAVIWLSLPASSSSIEACSASFLLLVLSLFTVPLALFEGWRKIFQLNSIWNIEFFFWEDTRVKVLTSSLWLPLVDEGTGGAKLEEKAMAATPNAVLVARRSVIAFGASPWHPGFRARVLNNFWRSLSLSAAFLLNAQAEWKIKLKRKCCVYWFF